jgi:hypothetical protein
MSISAPAGGKISTPRSIVDASLPRILDPSLRYILDAALPHIVDASLPHIVDASLPYIVNSSHPCMLVAALPYADNRSSTSSILPIRGSLRYFVERVVLVGGPVFVAAGESMR